MGQLDNSQAEYPSREGYRVETSHRIATTYINHYTIPQSCRLALAINARAQHFLCTSGGLFCYSNSLNSSIVKIASLRILFNILG